MSIDRYGAVSRKCHAVMTQHNVFRLGRYLAAFTVVGWTGLDCTRPQKDLGSH